VVDDDVILEQVEFSYDSAGNVVETVGGTALTRQGTVPGITEKG